MNDAGEIIRSGAAEEIADLVNEFAKQRDQILTEV